MANYVLSEELKRAVVQVINQHQSSFQPRPKRGRRVRNGGGASDAVFYTAIIDDPIPAGDAQDLQMGKARIYGVGPSGITQTTDDTVYNPFPVEVYGTVTCTRITNNYYLIVGIAPYYCEVMPNVVTDVACYTDPITGAKSIRVVQEPIKFLTTPQCQQQNS